MSYEDAPRNTARAQQIRDSIRDHSQETVTVTLDRELLLYAADALEAQGVKGWAAARLAAVDHWSDESFADVVLEAADTYEDTLTHHRKRLGAEKVQRYLDELEEQS